LLGLPATAFALTPTGALPWSPAVTSAAAPAATHSHASELVITTFNSQRFAGYQSFGNTMMCPSQNSAIGLS